MTSTNELCSLVSSCCLQPLQARCAIVKLSDIPMSETPGEFDTLYSSVMQIEIPEDIPESGHVMTLALHLAILLLILLEFDLAVTTYQSINCVCKTFAVT